MLRYISGRHDYRAFIISVSIALTYIVVYIFKLVV